MRPGPPGQLQSGGDAPHADDQARGLSTGTGFALTRCVVDIESGPNRSARSRWLWVGALALAISGAGCIGYVVDSGTAPVPAEDDPQSPPRVPVPVVDPNRPPLIECDPAQSDFPPQRLWMLTQPQLNATARTIYEQGPDLLTDATRTYFGNEADLVQLGTASIEALSTNAETLAAGLATDVAAEASCDLSDAACFRSTLSAIVAVAWRQSEADVASIVDTFHPTYLIGAEHSPELGLQVVLEAVLRSPHFLYRSELGTPVASDPTLFRLNAWEVASALAFNLTNAPPDGALRAAAADGTLLSDPSVYEAQVERLIGLGLAGDLPGDFAAWLTGVGEYVGTGGLPSVPELSGASARAMLEELTAFASQALDDGGWEAFLTSPNDNGGVGVLTNRGVMARLAAPESIIPTRRGFFVLNQLFCQTPTRRPPLPEDAPGIDPTLSGRERYDILIEIPACASCHMTADPVGFAFDDFGWTGRPVNDPSIDASGELTNTAESNGRYDDHRGLARIMAESREVEACLDRRLLEFVEGRVSSRADDCRVAGMMSDQNGGDSFSGLLRSILGRDLFFRRAAQ